MSLFLGLVCFAIAFIGIVCLFAGSPQRKATKKKKKSSNFFVWLLIFAVIGAMGYLLLNLRPDQIIMAFIIVPVGLSILLILFAWLMGESAPPPRSKIDRDTGRYL